MDDKLGRVRRRKKSNQRGVGEFIGRTKRKPDYVDRHF